MLDGTLFAAVNHVLAQSPWATGRLSPFAGRVVRVTAGPWQLRFSIGADGYLGSAAAEHEGFDVDVELPADAPLRIARGYDQLMAAARISGAADLADALSFVFSRLRWDAEEDLSRLVGDIAARRLVGLVTSALTWQRAAARNVTENIGEFLTHEQALLTQQHEVGDLATGVASLGESLLRLESRLTRLR